MLRIIKELFNIKLKCDRLGHIPESHNVKIRRNGYGGFDVMQDFKADVDYCKRCGKQLSEPKNEKYYTGYTSVTMPTLRWDELRDKGYIIV